MASIQVKSGDTLTRLSQQYGVSLQDILNSNPTITDPNKIAIGQSINLPNATFTGATPEATLQQQTTNAQGEVFDALGRRIGRTTPTQTGTTQPMQQVGTQPVQQGQVQPVQPQQQIANQMDTFASNSGLMQNPDGTYSPAQPQQDQSQQGFGTTKVAAPGQFGLGQSPINSYIDEYKRVYNELGIPSIKEQFDAITKQIQDVDDELGDKIAEVNENPWLSQNTREVRSRQLQDKYDRKKDSLINRLRLTESLFERGVEDAKFLAGQSFNIQQDMMNKAFDRATRLAEAEAKAKDASISEIYGTGIIGEYNFARSQGYTGTFNEYQNEDANRKQSIARAGVSGTTSGSTGTRTIGGGVSGAGAQAAPSGQFGTPEYVVNKLLSSGTSKTKPVASEREALGKFANVIAQTSQLYESLTKTNTDPIIGSLRNFNPYDFDARTVNAQINALVPNVARGVYGEVGVLTDSDVARYLQTLPNIKSTKQQNDFVAAMTVRNAMRSYEQTLLNLASSGVNVSGFADTYRNMVDKANQLDAKITAGTTAGGSSSTGAQAIFDNVVGSTPQSSSWIVNLWNKIF